MGCPPVRGDNPRALASGLSYVQVDNHGLTINTTYNSVDMFFISKCSGYIIISYMEVYAIFCTRMGFTKMFVMSLDFAEIKNIENMSVMMTYRTH